jgi:hypothetical protein
MIVQALTQALFAPQCMAYVDHDTSRRKNDINAVFVRSYQSFASTWERYRPRSTELTTQFPYA